jgi:multidrug efflux system membrane fusion protein
MSIRRNGALLALFLILVAAVCYFFPALPEQVTSSKWLAQLTGAGSPSASSGGTARAPPVNLGVVPVKVASVRVEDVPISITGIGTVQAYNTVSVRSKVDGEIIQILYREGQDVKQGDVLIKIDPKPLQAQLDQQIAIRDKDRALLEGAMLDMQRYETLVKNYAVSRQQFDQQHALVDQYKAQVANDEAQIDYARTQLDFTSIRAPINGRVGIRLVDQGNFLHASDGTVLVVITQLQPISVVFTLSATMIGETSLTLGQARAAVAAIAQDNTTVIDRGFVEVVDNQVDPSTGTIKVKASFPNSALKLWPGNFVNGRITVDTRKAGTTVPSVAVRHGPRGDYVWIVKADQTVAVRSVATGQAFGDRTLVDRGLARAERVVIEGYYRLQTGSKVSIEDPSSNLSDRRPQGVQSPPPEAD